MAKTKKTFDMGDILNDDTKELFTSTESSSRFVVMDIPLDKIHPSEKNLYGIRDVEELAQSILDIGLQHNITLRDVDDEYTIISGERRYHAYKHLLEKGHTEYATIPAKVEVIEDEELFELNLLLSNATARELTDFEKTYQAMRLKTIYQSRKSKGEKLQGRVRDLVAENMNVSSSQISRMEKIFGNLIIDFMKVYRDEEIGISDAYDLSLLTQDEQEAVFKGYEREGLAVIRKAVAKFKTPPPASPVPQHEPKPTPGPTPVPTPIAAPVAASTPEKKGMAAQQPHPIDAPRTEPKEPGALPQPQAPIEPIVAAPVQAMATQANQAQRAVLVELGKEAVLDFAQATNREKELEFANKIEAFTMVAAAFGLDREAFEIEIHDIPEYQEKYGANADEGAK